VRSLILNILRSYDLFCSCEARSIEHPKVSQEKKKRKMAAVEAEEDEQNKKKRKQEHGESTGCKLEELSDERGNCGARVQEDGEAELAAVPEQRAGAEEEQPTEEVRLAAANKKLATILRRCGFCGLCGDVRRDLVGHKRNRKNCAEHALTRPLRPEELEQLKADFWAEYADPDAERRRRTAAAKAHHEKNWQPPTADGVAAGGEPEEYKVEFGKHKGKTVAKVWEKDRMYFGHLLATDPTFLDQYPALRKELDDRGYLEDMLKSLPEKRREKAERILLRAADSPANRDRPQEEEHPEMKRLRLLQMVEASKVLAGEQKNVALAVVKRYEGQSAKGKVRTRRRNLQSRAAILLGHCSVCGSIAHREPTCPYKDRTAPLVPVSRGSKSLAWELHKDLARTVARLKYTRISIRGPGYRVGSVKKGLRAKHLSRAPVRRTQLSMSRATPSALHGMLKEDGILYDLKGLPCPSPKCKARGSPVPDPDAVLGKLCTDDKAGRNINLATACHRCNLCRLRHPVTLHNPLFTGLVGRHSKGVTPCVLSWWNCLEGASITYTRRQLGINEDTVGDYYARCQEIMAEDAVRRQGLIKWGTGTTKTVEVEIDASVFGKWRQVQQVSASDPGPAAVDTVQDCAVSSLVSEQSRPPGEVEEVGTSCDICFRAGLLDL